MKAIRMCLIVAGVFVGGCKARTVVERWSPEGGKPQPPAAFKHARSGGSDPAPEDWWKRFRDPVLNDLMDDVESYNPDVKAALARVDQAHAVLGITGAQRFPTGTGGASYSNERDSPNSLRFVVDELDFEFYRVAANASWELDLWGRIRGAYRRDRFRAEAAGEQYRNALLSMRATLARQYFALRSVEREAAILRDAVASREEALRLQNSLAARGAGTDVDVARARTELETTRAEAEGLERTRGKLEHAIAALTGRAPSDLTLTEQTAAVHLPEIPSGVPSELLVRRPDLLAAEDTLLAASLQVAVSRGDFLPRLSLTGTGGMASLQTSNLFAGRDSLFYSLGPQLDVPIFQAGRRVAAVAEAKAKWDEAAEAYRGALLTAVREVDDSLLDLQVLSRQVATQQRAVEAAAKATELAQKRFVEGAASYFEVVDAQRTKLDADRAANALRGERAAATVQLIQALGGAW